jgi:hypothetical protein
VLLVEIDGATVADAELLRGHPCERQGIFVRDVDVVGLSVRVNDLELARLARVRHEVAALAEVAGLRRG